MPYGTQSPEKFAQHLRDVEWPASKEELIRNARSTAAPPEIIQALERLPGIAYENEHDLLVAYETTFRS